jgi:hypothetical protein
MKGGHGVAEMMMEAIFKPSGVSHNPIEECET